MSAFLHKKKILVTRERKQAKVFSEKIVQHGGIPIEVPLLKIACKGCFKWKQHQPEFSKYAWIFFTSSNGVNCFFQAIKKNRIDIHLLTGCKIAAVGPKTEIALKNHGYTADFIPTTYNASVMASEFSNRFPQTGPLLLVRGNRSSSILPTQFSKRGFQYELMEVYETTYNYEMKQTLNEQLLTNDIDFLTFTSPSTVDAFIDMISIENRNKIARNLICVCIGTTTEKRAKEHGFNTTLVPKKFTIEGIIKQIGCFLTEKG